MVADSMVLPIVHLTVEIDGYGKVAAWAIPDVDSTKSQPTPALRPVMRDALSGIARQVYSEKGRLDVTERGEHAGVRMVEQMAVEGP